MKTGPPGGQITKTTGRKAGNSWQIKKTQLKSIKGTHADNSEQRKERRQ